MKRNTNRILTSHGGNLPRPNPLNELIDGGKDRGGAFQKAYHERLPDAVNWIVDKQIEHGQDIVNDGEYVKAGNYGAYLRERVSGYEDVPDKLRTPKREATASRERADFPGTYASGLWLMGSGGPVRPGFATPGEIPPNLNAANIICNAPMKYTGQAAIAEDITNLKAAVAGKDVQGYIAALGPLSLGSRVVNEHYKTEEEYMMAVAEACGEEYKAITDAGLIVQVDEPEFFTTWSFYPDWELKDLRKYLSFAVELINHALKGIDPELVRFHSCWGSGHRPHSHDIELKHIADLMVKIDACQYAIEAGNVRHEHEWAVWKDCKLPDGKMLMPGVISHATDLVEHPDLVAERICNYANIIGKENVQTTTDCGIGSRVGHEEIVWAKLDAMAEGARRASDKLFG